MPTINPLYIEIEIEKKLYDLGLPIRVRRLPSERANAPISKSEMWVRYVDSDFQKIATADNSYYNYTRKMTFHVITEVMSLQNHEKALTAHNLAIAILTNWTPTVKLDDPSETQCKNGNATIIEPLQPIKDRFERYAEGRFQYRTDLTITVPHYGLSPTFDGALINGIISEIYETDNSKSPVVKAGFYRNKIDDIGSDENKDSDFFVDTNQ